MKKEQFKIKLHPVHKTFWNRAYKKLSSKMSALMGSLKRRSEDAGVKCTIDKDVIRKMFYDVYGEGCRYCDRKLDYRNIVCDHIVPLVKKGPSTKENLQLICKTCNTRKGPLNEDDFIVLMQLVEGLPEELNKYVMRKLAKGGRW